MPTKRQIAESLPAEYRKKIVLEWIPNARPDFGNDEFKMLWKLYFLFIDPNGVQASDCPSCRNDVLKNWRGLSATIAQVEHDAQLLENL